MTVAVSKKKKNGYGIDSVLTGIGPAEEGDRVHCSQGHCPFHKASRGKGSGAAERHVVMVWKEEDDSKQRPGVARSRHSGAVTAP